MKNPDKRSLTSRQNAKKSTGPKTEAGKRASCLNAVTHAAYADTLILPHESLEDYERLVQSHFQMWKPQNPIEESFVSQMATTLWRLQRMAPAQSNMIRVQIARMAIVVNAEFVTTNAAGLYALAANEMKGDSVLDRLARHEKFLFRQYERIHNYLMKLRADFPPSDDPSDWNQDQPIQQQQPQPQQKEEAPSAEASEEQAPAHQPDPTAQLALNSGTSMERKNEETKLFPEQTCLHQLHTKVFEAPRQAENPDPESLVLLATHAASR